MRTFSAGIKLLKQPQIHRETASVTEKAKFCNLTYDFKANIRELAENAAGLYRNAFVELLFPEEVHPAKIAY